MKRDIFRRAVRMQHHFGTLEERNGWPFGPQTFDPGFNQGRRVDHLARSPATPPLEIQQCGEHMYREPPSAVVKPNGRTASLNGPSADLAEQLGRPAPVGTKRRYGPPKTDK